MNKITKYIFFTYLLTFLFIFNVKAECSYQERKDLLNVAKNIDISVEPVEVSKENGTYDFKFIITGLTKDIFIEYYNDNNGMENYISYDMLENGVYSFVDDNSYDVYKYNFLYYTTNKNCYAKKIYSKNIIKPMYNIYSENNNCTFDYNDGFKYCEKFFSKNNNLTLSEFNQELIKFNNSKNQEEVIIQNKSFVEKNLVYIISGIIVLISAIVVSVVILKKKKEL